MRTLAGGGVAAALLGACGDTVEVADPAPPATVATASPSAPPREECVPPPLPSVTPASILALGPDGPTFAEIRDQEDVDDVLAKVDAYDGKPGYAVKVYLGGRNGAIWWKGEPPTEVAALAGTSPSCVTVTIVRVPYDAVDLAAAMNRVFDAAKQGEVPRPNGGGPSRAYDGIEVGYPDPPEGPEADALRTRLSGIARMPVTLVGMGPTAE